MQIITSSYVFAVFRQTLPVTAFIPQIIEGLEETVKTETGQKCQTAKALLARVNEHPELFKGITNEDQIIENTDLMLTC